MIIQLDSLLNRIGFCIHELVVFTSCIDGESFQ